MKKIWMFAMALLLCMQCIPVQAGLGPYVSFSDLFHYDGDAFMEMLEEGNTRVYTHPTYGYSVTVDKNWIAVDKTNLDSCIAACRNGEIAVPGINVLDSILMSQSQITQKDCVLFMDLQGNAMMIKVQDFGTPISKEIFETEYIPMVLQAYKEQIPDLRVLREGTASKCGDLEFNQMEIELNTQEGTQRIVQYRYLEGSMLYTVMGETQPGGERTVMDKFITKMEYTCSTFASNR